MAQDSRGEIAYKTLRILGISQEELRKQELRVKENQGCIYCQFDIIAAFANGYKLDIDIVKDFFRIDKIREGHVWLSDGTKA